MKELQPGAILRAIMAERCLVLPVGMPWAGKSTLAERLEDSFVGPHLRVVSTDAARITLGGRRDWLGDEAAVFRTISISTAQELSRGQSVYVDATNLVAKWRDELVSIAASATARIIVVRMDRPLSICRQLRLARPDRFSDEVWATLEESLRAFPWSEFSPNLISSSALVSALDNHGCAGDNLTSEL